MGNTSSFRTGEIRRRTHTCGIETATTQTQAKHFWQSEWKPRPGHLLRAVFAQALYLRSTSCYYAYLVRARRPSAVILWSPSPLPPFLLPACFIEELFTPWCQSRGSCCTINAVDEVFAQADRSAGPQGLSGSDAIACHGTYVLTNGISRTGFIAVIQVGRCRWEKCRSICNFNLSLIS